jgi:hypothetical protein
MLVVSTDNPILSLKKYQTSKHAKGLLVLIKFPELEENLIHDLLDKQRTTSLIIVFKDSDQLANRENFILGSPGFSKPIFPLRKTLIFLMLFSIFF